MFLKKFGDVTLISARSQSCATNRTVAWIFVRIALAFDGEVTAVADHMRIGHDAVAIDDESGANAALNRARIPRRAIIRLDFGRGDADKTLLNLAVRLCRQCLRRKEQHAGQKDKTIHEDEAGKIKQKLDKANLTLFGTDLRLGKDSRSKKPLANFCRNQKKRRQSCDHRRLYPRNSLTYWPLASRISLRRIAHVLMRLLHRIEFLLLLRRQERPNLRHRVVHDGFRLLHRLFMDRANLWLSLVDDRLDFGLLIRRQIQIVTQSVEHHSGLMKATAMMPSRARLILSVNRGPRDKLRGQLLL